MYNHKPNEYDTSIYYHQICVFMYNNCGEDTDPLNDSSKLYYQPTFNDKITCLGRLKASLLNKMHYSNVCTNQSSFFLKIPFVLSHPCNFSKFCLLQGNQNMLTGSYNGGI